MNFLRKTTDSIAARFHQMVADLMDVIERAEAEAARHEQIANEAIAKRLEHMEEGAKASRLAEKIKALLS